MSSAYVRTQIIDFLAAEAPDENVVNLSGQFDELQDMLEQAQIPPDDPWLGVQFIGYKEDPITIGSNNTTGKYRETGAVYFHVVGVAKLGVSDTILARGETLRNLLRGKKLGTMFVESVSPMNSESGAALKFEGGFLSFSFILVYQNDLDL